MVVWNGLRFTTIPWDLVTQVKAWELQPGGTRTCEKARTFRGENRLHTDRCVFWMVQGIVGLVLTTQARTICPRRYTPKLPAPVTAQGHASLAKMPGIDCSVGQARLRPVVAA